MTDLEPLASEPGPRTPGFLVVGVGASAGGLEAFTRLLSSIPAGAPLALVMVQHLARDHESILAQLLSARTALEVAEATDGDRICAGHVYVIRPGTHMSVVDGSLRVQARPARGVADAAVDHLLVSMADEYCEKSVGVLLSGSGSDGVLGLQRICNAGGITFAQAPEEATAPSMPGAAIASGAVSMVLKASEIAEELVRLAEYPFYRQASPDATPQPDATAVDVHSILRVLRRATGVDFTRYKLPTIHRRIQRRMAIAHVHDVPAYLALLSSSSEEAKKLHDDILINVTSFFRDPESFQVLAQSVLPNLLRANRGDGPIRVWVPGCSSGEEAYSLAMTFLDVLAKQQENIPIAVFGTDLSERMIEQARAGLYPESIASDVPPDFLRRYFVKVEAGYRVSAEVRERCVFARQDITRDPPFSRLDMVMCRNLLIYLSQPAQHKVTELFHYALLPHGVLTLGRSETIGPLPELFSVIDGRWKIYQRKPAKLPHRHLDLGTHYSESSPGGTRMPARGTLRERKERDIHGEANRLLLDRYAPPLVIVDDASRVVRTQGRTGPFLELPSGDVSLDVLRMIRPGLMSPVRRLLQEVKTNGGTARKEGVELRTEDSPRVVNIEVSLLRGSDAPHYMILFEDSPPRSTPGDVSQPSNNTSSDQRALEQLEDELSEMRIELESLIHELEAANDELQSANEEILSSNEELQSTNEELDTAREELQATNEELGRVNDELQGRNSELSRANGDLLNLLESVDISILMVTSDRKIRRFTPAARRTLNLIPSDVGRPISHIRPNIVFGDLESELGEVIEKGTIREREVRDDEGRTYLATIRPYTNMDNDVDGAVLALFDISEQLSIPREMAAALMSAVRDPVLLLDGNFVAQRANDSFYRMYDSSAEQTEGKAVFELQNGRWNVPELRTMLEGLSAGGKSVEGFVFDHGSPHLGQKRMLIDGKHIGSARSTVSIRLLIFREQ